MARMFRVYSIIERQRQDDYWLNIGVAFPHDDGKGFNVMLQALPIHGNGKIVLREHEPKADERDETADLPLEDRGGHGHKRNGAQRGRERNQRQPLTK